MERSIVFMFSGQGSMGKDLYETNTFFKDYIHYLDECAADILGESVLKIIYDKTKSISEPFDKTIYTHPAIFMIEFTLSK